MRKSFLRLALTAVVIAISVVSAVAQTTVETSGDIEAGDDGDLQFGEAWPRPRFTIEEVAFVGKPNGTVTDNLTGLVWLRDANCFGALDWPSALAAASALRSGDSCPVSGSHLLDGSIAGQWRLPNLLELQSLVHYGVFDPALPDTSGEGQWSEGDPFLGVQSEFYWSSTTGTGYPDLPWFASLSTGGIGRYDLLTSLSPLPVWPVRDGG